MPHNQNAAVAEKLETTEEAVGCLISRARDLLSTDLFKRNFALYQRSKQITEGGVLFFSRDKKVRRISKEVCSGMSDILSTHVSQMSKEGEELKFQLDVAEETLDLWILYACMRFFTPPAIEYARSKPWILMELITIAEQFRVSRLLNLFKIFIDLLSLG